MKFSYKIKSNIVKTRPRLSPRSSLYFLMERNIINIIHVDKYIYSFLKLEGFKYTNKLSLLFLSDCEVSPLIGEESLKIHSDFPTSSFSKTL